MKFFTDQKWSLIALSVFSILTVYAFYHAKEISLDHDFDRYFGKDNAQIQDFNKYSDKYGGDGDFILVGVENEAGVFEKEFLKNVKVFGDRILLHPHILEIYSPCHNCFQATWGGMEGISQKPCISFENLKEDSIKLSTHVKYQGTIFSRSKPAVLLFIKTEKKLTQRQGDELINLIREQLQILGLNKSHIAGKIISTSHFTSRMETEILLFFIVSILLISLFLWFTFRAIWGILIPLIIVLATNIWTIAIMKLTGKSFDLLMIMLPTIIFVVGMSDLIHLFNKYLYELRLGRNKAEAITNSLKEVGLATLLTSLTTAIGFFSLIAMEIEPVQEFGIYSGIGVIVAYVLTFSCTPFILVLLPIPQQLIDQNHKKQWNNFLGRRFLWLLRNQKQILFASLILGLIGLLGVKNLKVNNYLLEDLNEKDPIKKDFLFFEENFSGVRPFELELIVRDSSKTIYSYEIAHEIDKIEKYLSSRYTEKGVGFMISPLDPVKLIYFIKHHNKPQFYKLPKERAYYSNLSLVQRYTAKGELHNVLVAEDSLSGRISGKIKDVGSLIIKEENNKFLKYCQDSVNSNLLGVNLTGTPLLIDKNNENLSRNLIYGLLIALSIIGLLIGLIYRAWIVVFIALIVNILPLVIIGGMMYFLNFDIKISTALIFTLAFGIAVDDTIHLLSKLKIELAKGSSMLYALKRSYLTTGKAIIVTTLILCGGFISLLMSNFMSIYITGLLVSTTLLIAVVVDLTLLPVLLILFRKQIEITPKAHKID